MSLRIGISCKQVPTEQHLKGGANKTGLSMRTEILWALAMALLDLTSCSTKASTSEFSDSVTSSGQIFTKDINVQLPWLLWTAPTSSESIMLIVEVAEINQLYSTSTASCKWLRAQTLHKIETKSYKSSSTLSI